MTTDGIGKERAPEASASPPALSPLLERALLSTFLSTVPDFVHFKDRDGRFIAVSDSKLLRNGLKHRDEIIGKTDFDFIAEASAKKTEADEKEVMRTGHPIVNQLESIIWPDGRETWSLINKMPLRDESGAIIGTYALIKDVTQSHLTSELDRSLVATFLANVPDCVYFKDRESRFIAVSAAMTRLFGGKSIVGKTDFDFFDESHARPAFEDEQEIIRTGTPILGKLEKETWPDGHITWVLTKKLPIRNERGEITGTFGISTDVTESKRMEFALEKSRRELMAASRMAGMAEVATGVLHNVGNVLNSLNVSASVIANGLRQSKAESLSKVGELLREHANDLGTYLTQDPKGKLIPAFTESLARHFTEERARLLSEIESLQKNVDHVKEIVALQQGYATMTGVTEPLLAATLLEDALRMNASALLRHDIEVVRDFGAVPPILAEQAKALQILVNLITNAKYAADEGGRTKKTITLRVAVGAAGCVQLCVQDNGIGIAPENLAKIFQHGFTTKPTGHGFGLHSSANAATEMHGSLTAHSDGIGHGATFILELPIATGPAADALR